MTRVALSEIATVTARALERHGAAPVVAADVARAVRVAEAKGNRICGLYYVEAYCRQLQSGRVDGRATPEVHHDSPGAVRVDARHGFAQSAFAAGFATAVAATRANGTCGFSVEHGHTCTALGYFTEQFADAGLLAIGSTNSTARVAPPGGTTRVLGTNPVAMAVPARDGGVAFQFDFSTSAVALGTITMAAAAGESIPAGWALDEHGEATTDPDAALRGSMLSAAGHKGFGFGLMAEVLASALTGSRASVDQTPHKSADGPPPDIGEFYLLVDPRSFSGDRFWNAVELLAGRVGAQPGARLPGTRRDLPVDVDVDDQLWAATLDLAGGAVDESLP